jgi:type VI secretion system protein ImpH
VVLGPVPQHRFEQLLPGGREFEKLEGLVKSYAGDQLAWDVRLIVDETREPWSLGKRSRLGWTTSLGKSKKSGTIVVRES